MSAQAWIVVRVKPNEGARAEVNARNQGYEWYVPRGMFRSERTRQLREEPLFPGYAFARHPAGLWQSLTGTFGVAEVMRIADDRPAEVSAEEVAHWRAREGPDGLVRLEAREFTEGERLHVDRGAVSLDAVFDGMAARDRIFVLMSVMGRQVRTEVAVRDVSRG